MTATRAQLDATRWHLQHGPIDLIIGADGEAAAVELGRTLDPEAVLTEDGERTPLAGETWVSMVEFSKPLKAMGVLSYGDSSQPGTKHHNDQLKYVASRTLRTLWVKRADVEKHVEETTTY